MTGNHPEQSEAVSCIYRANEICPISCPIYSVAKSVQEMKQPEWIDTVRKFSQEFGLSEGFVRSIEYSAKEPIGLGRVVKFYGLQLSDCIIYLRGELSKIDPNAH